MAILRRLKIPRRLYLRLRSSILLWGSFFRHLWDYVCDHPKFAGLLAFVALAVTFSPKASVTATWICLFLAWLLAVAVIGGIATIRLSGHPVIYTLILAIFVGFLFVPFGQWLTERKDEPQIKSVPQHPELSKRDILDTIKEGVPGLFTERLETKVFRKSDQPHEQAKPQAKPTQETQQKIVKIHFKESPLLTDQRRRLIQKEIDSFYEYLSQIGFRLAKELPPLGVRRSMTETNVMPGSVFEAQINLPEAGIDDPETIRLLFAHHVFRRLFASDPKVRFGSETEAIFSDYYVSSFSGKNRNDGNDRKWSQAKWVNALWDIRTEYRQDFADRLLFYVAELWSMPKPNDQDFDKFFMQRFLAGLHVIDNVTENEARIREILKKRGI